MLSLECVTRSARHLPCYYVGDFSEFYQELEQYVRYKKYDTRFCDIVLNIMSNVLKMIIFVIDKSDAGLNVYAVTPCDHNQITDTTLSDELDMDFIVLYREGDHYDACVKVYPCRSKTITDCDADYAGTGYQPCEPRPQIFPLAANLQTPQQLSFRSMVIEMNTGAATRMGNVMLMVRTTVLIILMTMIQPSSWKLLEAIMQKNW